MNQHIEPSRMCGSDTANPPEQAMEEQHQFEHAERLNLADVICDESLSVHRLSRFAIRLHEISADVEVFDLDQVFATPSAKAAIKRAYLTPLFLVEQYARHYTNGVFRPVTRGNDKGRFILDPLASNYVRQLGDGSVLIVKGATIKVDGHATRTLTISCGDLSSAGEAA